MTNTQEPTKRIIKINQCSTVSSNSTLTYHIGYDEKDSSIYFLIKANTGGGFFNDEWIALADIEKRFLGWPVDNPLTSFALNGLFTGKSANSPAFLMAILKEEGIIMTLKGKHRNYEYQGDTEFLDIMNRLMADGVDLKVEVDTDNKFVKANENATKKSTRSSKSHRKPA
jgi:hypothetical protein